MANKPRWLVWAHDMYPYILCGQIHGLIHNGGYATVQYGRGFYFKGIIVTEEQGKELRLMINVLRSKRQDAEDMLRHEFNTALVHRLEGLPKIEALLPEHLQATK